MFKIIGRNLKEKWIKLADEIEKWKIQDGNEWAFYVKLILWG